MLLFVRGSSDCQPPNNDSAPGTNSEENPLICVTEGILEKGRGRRACVARPGVFRGYPCLCDALFSGNGNLCSVPKVRTSHDFTRLPCETALQRSDVKDSYTRVCVSMSPESTLKLFRAIWEKICGPNDTYCPETVIPHGPKIPPYEQGNEDNQGIASYQS